MKRRRDPYTLLLPFEQEGYESYEWQRSLLLQRLGRYLVSGRSLPKRLPLLRLLPSLNDHQPDEELAKFTEEEAAQLLADLGATVEPNPYVAEHSHYRVTIPLELIECAVATYRTEAVHSEAKKLSK